MKAQSSVELWAHNVPFGGSLRGNWIACASGVHSPRPPAASPNHSAQARNPTISRFYVSTSLCTGDATHNQQIPVSIIPCTNDTTHNEHISHLHQSPAIGVHVLTWALGSSYGPNGGPHHKMEQSCSFFLGFTSKTARILFQYWPSAPLSTNCLPNSFIPVPRRGA
jgi:hypothetical protein